MEDKIMLQIVSDTVTMIPFITREHKTKINIQRILVIHSHNYVQYNVHWTDDSDHLWGLYKLKGDNNV